MEAVAERAVEAESSAPPVGAIAAFLSSLPSSRTSALFSGLYAWFATVALPVFRAEASLSCKVAAFVALLLLLLGAFVQSRSAVWGRGLGLWGFVGCSLIAWLLAGDLLAVAALDPVRSSLGAIGWAFYAFGWGAVRDTREIPEDNPLVMAGHRLSPRGRLSPVASWVFGFSCLAAAAPALIAWRVVRPAHGLLAHAVAIACAVAVVSAGATVAAQHSKWRPAGTPKQRLNRATGALGIAFVLLVLGVFLALI